MLDWSQWQSLASISELRFGGVKLCSSTSGKHLVQLHESIQSATTEHHLISSDEALGLHARTLSSHRKRAVVSRVCSFVSPAT